MIFIDRNRLDGQGRSIQPGKAWFDRATAATDTAKEEGDAHVIQEDVYRDNAARAALEELFHRKCAYCESDISNSTWEVEHFRPKGRVAERTGHTGYYWLAYTWSNLYPACEFTAVQERRSLTAKGAWEAGFLSRSGSFRVEVWGYCPTFS